MLANYLRSRKVWVTITNYIVQWGNIHFLEKDILDIKNAFLEHTLLNVIKQLQTRHIASKSWPTSE